MLQQKAIHRLQPSEGSAGAHPPCHPPSSSRKAIANDEWVSPLSLETVANDVQVSLLSQGGQGGIAFRIKPFQRSQSTPRHLQVPPCAPLATTS